MSACSLLQRATTWSIIAPPGSGRKERTLKSSPTCRLKDSSSSPATVVQSVYITVLFLCLLEHTVAWAEVFFLSLCCCSVFSPCTHTSLDRVYFYFLCCTLGSAVCVYHCVVSLSSLLAHTLAWTEFVVFLCCTLGSAVYVYHCVVSLSS